MAGLQTADQACSFNDELPREMRDQVYTEALRQDTEVLDLTTHGCGDAATDFSPALLAVCKQIRFEALPIHFTANGFRYIATREAAWEVLLVWLARLLPTDVEEHVTKLIIEIHRTTDVLKNCRPSCRAFIDEYCNIVASQSTHIDLRCFDTNVLKQVQFVACTAPSRAYPYQKVLADRLEAAWKSVFRERTG